MCPAQIAGAKKKEKNVANPQATPGPKKIVYKQEFHAVLRDLINEYPTFKYIIHLPHFTSYDSKYQFYLTKSPA